jgi:hypothetical protein
VYLIHLAASSTNPEVRPVGTDLEESRALPVITSPYSIPDDHYSLQFGIMIHEPPEAASLPYTISRTIDKLGFTWLKYILGVLALEKLHPLSRLPGLPSILAIAHIYSYRTSWSTYRASLNHPTPTKKQ